ncbi:RICIN domain-containing protein [Solirubrobacter sp. CPCC 204708]|nr:RICIN domain-containing protein [Solirubrobacter deserti]
MGTGGEGNLSRRLAGTAAALTLAVAVLASAGAASARAQLFWVNAGGSALGRANLDGSGADHRWLPVPDGSQRGVPFMRTVAVSTSHVYWSNSRVGIGRANLDGSGANSQFIPTSNAFGVAVDGTYVYWSSSGAIGRAKLDGSEVDPTFITGVAASGLAVDGTHIFWARNTNPGTIGRANLDGSGADPNFIQTDRLGVESVAVDDAHVYWTVSTAKRIGRANLDGSAVDLDFIASVGSPAAVAVDDAHLYWTTSGPNSIGRAEVDGSGGEETFIAPPTTGSFLPFGIAVKPTTEPSVPTGWQTLRFAHSEHGLTVSGASEAPGAAILQWPVSTGDYHSQWQLKLRGERGFEVVNRHSGQCLDIWSERPGALLQWPCDGGLGQRWEFETAAPDGSHRTLKNVYSGLVVNQAGATSARGGAVIQWPRTQGAANEQLSITPAPSGGPTSGPTPTPAQTSTEVPTGWVSLGFLHSGQALSVSDASAERGAPLEQRPFVVNATHSQWKLVPVDQRGFEIVNRSSGQCLDIWSEEPGALLQWPCHGGLGQRWEFDAAASGPFFSVVKNVYSGLVLNQAGATTAPGGAVFQWHQTPADNERLVIAPAPQPGRR